MVVPHQLVSVYVTQLTVTEALMKLQASYEALN